MSNQHETERTGPLRYLLPEGWPDGPTDEVIGQLLYAALRQQHDTDDMVKGSAYTLLRGTFDLRLLGIRVGPYIASLLLSGPPRIVAKRLTRVLGVNARSVLESVLAYLPEDGDSSE